MIIVIIVMCNINDNDNIIINKYVIILIWIK